MEQIRYSFLVKRNKQRADGKIPLYFRIRMGKETRDIFLKMHITHEDWNAAKQKDGSGIVGIGSSNSYRRLIKSSAFAIIVNTELTGRIIKATIIKAVTVGSSLGRNDFKVEVTQSDLAQKSLATAQIEAKVVDVTLNYEFETNSMLSE
jgi:hypothetical protein